MNGALLALVVAVTQPPWGGLQLGQRLLLLGEPMSGKSTLAEKLAADAHRALFYDLCRDYEKPGRLVVTIDELEKWPGLLDGDFSRVTVRATAEEEKGIADEVLRLLILAERAGKDFEQDGSGGRVFVIDEVGDYRRYAEGALNRLFRRGRHYGLVPVLASQVPTDIPLTCRRIASDVYCLAQSYEKELRALEELYGETFAAKVRAWRHYEAPAHWTRRPTDSEHKEGQP